MRGGCGSDVVLETVNASRAFLTIDSGFPLSDLEEALRTNRPFTLDYHPTRVPILYAPDYWQCRIRPRRKMASLSITSWAIRPCAVCTPRFRRLDPDTAEQLRKDMPAQKAKAFAHVLDFFGGMFEIRDGKVTRSGRRASEKAWADLVGVPPEQGPAFFERLFAKDDGWLAATSIRWRASTARCRTI